MAITVMGCVTSSVQARQARVEQQASPTRRGSDADVRLTTSRLELEHMITQNAVGVAPWSLVLAIVFCGACSDSSLAGQGGASALPLRPESGESHAEWLRDWQAKLPVTVTLRKGEHKGEVQGAYYSRNTVQYPVYQATLSVKNNTGHALETAQALYLIQASTPSRAAPTRSTDVLEVIGGQFREVPAEDYAGVIELRGSKLTPDLELGLVDSIDADARRGFFGGFLDIVLSAGSGGNRLDRRFENEGDFGRAASGQTLTLETNDLQMTVRVRSDREGPLHLISPRLVFRDGHGSESSFRLIATFEKGAVTPSDITLLAIDDESWTAMAADGQQPLWKRMLAVQSLASVASPAATTALTRVADPAGGQPRSLRETALYALAERPDGIALARTLAVSKKEPWQVRRAAVHALGRSKNPGVITILRTVLDDSDNRVRDRAIDALAELGAKDAVSDLIALLSKRNASDVRSNIGSAIAKLGDTLTVDSLATLGTKTADLRRTLVPVMVRLGGASALSTLDAWFRAALPKGNDDEKWPVRMDVCAQLAAREDEASAILFRKCLADPHDWVRSAAIQAMSEPLNSEREALLVTLMSDSNAETSRAAIRALGTATSSVAKPKLLETVRTSALAKEIRWAALEALGNYDDADVTQELVGTLANETDANLRAETYSALARHQRPQALAAIEHGLRDATSYSTERAAWIVRNSQGTKACATALAALIARQDGEAADGLVNVLTLPGCRDRVSFDAIVGRLGSSDAAYDTAITRLLKSWTGQDAGTDKTKWAAMWK